MENPSPAAETRPMPWFIVGIILIVLGPLAYFTQMQLGWLSVPWHVPILATLGVAAMALSLAQQGGIARGIGIVPFVALCGFEWFFVLVLSPLPSYHGPAQPGQKLPAFSAKLASGEPFTQKDLEGGRKNAKRTVMLFFRGRW